MLPVGNAGYTGAQVFYKITVALALAHGLKK